MVGRDSAVIDFRETGNLIAFETYQHESISLLSAQFLLIQSDDSPQWMTFSRLARGMLVRTDNARWQQKHVHSRLTGTSAGPAIHAGR